MKEAYYAVIILVALAVVVGLILRKYSSGDRHFDEMQLKIRSDAYRSGFLITLAGLCILTFLMEDEGGILKWVDPSIVVFTVMMAGIVTFAVECIRKEAFFSFNDKGRSYMILCVIVCVVNGGMGIARIVNGTLWDNGRITFERGSTLVCGLSFLVLLIAFLVKEFRRKSEVME